MNKSWWKESVVYQIYPRSFNDSNGDGIGDIEGIIEKLDYLQHLGVDVLWLSPIFKSPNDDNGYDVSDYCEIMDEFGTMADFDRLLNEVHARGLKLILDLVPNHSSDEHPWFLESKKSKDNPYRDYYIWSEEPASNWASFFGGSAWELEEQTNEYYLHLFSKKQPDLNWKNPKVREEMYNVMHFWFSKGIDGFRIDVLPFISKREGFPAIDPSDFQTAIYEIYANGPHIHEYLQEMHDKVMSKYDVMIMGECIGVTPQQALDYVGQDRNEINTLYHFDHVNINYGPDGKYDPVPWQLSTFKKIFQEWDTAVAGKGWINLTLDNHDFPRMVSRFGNDSEYREASAKLLATLLFTMRGGPCIYQGSEIGMTNVAFDTLEEYDDVEVVNLHKEWKDKGKDTAPLLKAVHQQGRDNARTPMQWDGSPGAGFTSGTPWLKINPNFIDINVEKSLADEDSILHYYKKLLQFRKSNLTMVYGDFLQLVPSDENIFSYIREDSSGEFLIILNFSDDTREIPSEIPVTLYEQIISNYQISSSNLLPWEAKVYAKK